MTAGTWSVRGQPQRNWSRSSEAAIGKMGSLPRKTEAVLGEAVAHRCWSAVHGDLVAVLTVVPGHRY